MKSFNRLMAVAPFVIFSSLASAQVAFNDFSSDTYSPTYGYNPNTGWTVSGASSGIGIFESANQFVSGASGTLSDLILPSSLASGTGNVEVQLVNDNANTVGSTVLESWTMGTTGNFGTWTTPNVLSGDGSAVLASGTAYWVEVTAANEATSTLWTVWDFNDANVTGTDAYNQGTGWNYQPATLGAFKIDVRAAPEPASLIALGGIALGLLRRRASK